MHFCTILHLPLIVQNSSFVCLCVRVCGRTCSHERFDSGSHYRQEQFSHHKIEKRAALKNKNFSREPNWSRYRLRKCISSQRL